MHKKTGKIKICLICGKVFYSFPSCIKKGGGKFCSHKCAGKWLSQNKSGEHSPNWKGVRKTCLICGKIFYISPSYIKKAAIRGYEAGKFCSRECSSKWHSKNKRGENSPLWKQIKCICQFCGKEFFVVPAEIKRGYGKFCSRKCCYKWRKGENSPNWRGGTSFEYYPPKWTKKLKEKIKERDNFACQKCGSKKNLVIHHINYNKKDCKEKNLITLCRSCNGKVNTARTWWQRLFCRSIARKIFT